ncbi:unnamed protein product, partial [Lampetra fluviatilis]
NNNNWCSTLASNDTRGCVFICSTDTRIDAICRKEACLCMHQTTTTTTTAIRHQVAVTSPRRLCQARCTLRPREVSNARRQEVTGQTQQVPRVDCCARL